MHQEDVEIVRAAIDAFNRGDVDAAFKDGDKRLPRFPFQYRLGGYSVRGRLAADVHPGSERTTGPPGRKRYARDSDLATRLVQEREHGTVQPDRGRVEPT